MDHHHGPQPGDRPAAPRGLPRGPARAGRPATHPGRDEGRRGAGRAGGRRARRPAAPDLHLLPPGARDGCPGRADAPAPRRAHHRGDRARLHGRRADNGSATGPRQGQDPRRGDPLPGPERGRPPGPPAGRSGRRLSHLQRGLYRELRRAARARGPQRGGHPPGAAPGRAHARRAGGHGAAWAHAARRVAAGRPDDARGRARPAGRPGPRPLGPRPDLGRPGDRPAVPSPRPSRPIPDPGRDQRRPQRRAERRRHGLATDPPALRPAHVAWPEPGRGPQPGRRRGRGRGPEAALALVEGLDLDGYYLFHAIRADLLSRLGHDADARQAYEAAIARTENAAERDFLRRGRGALRSA